MQKEYRGKEKMLYLCFVDIEKAYHKSSEKGDVMGNEKERFTRSNCKGSDEPL